MGTGSGYDGSFGNYLPGYLYVSGNEDEIIRRISKKMEKSICKIYSDNNDPLGRGFFCKIQIYKNKNFHYSYILMTNNHVLGEKDIKPNKMIKISLNNGKNLEILIDISRKTFASTLYDITIIEMKPNDGIEPDSFLEIDKDIYKDNFKEIFISKSIYLLNEKNEVIHGKIIYINKYIYTMEYEYYYEDKITQDSLSGPLINKENCKVLGIQKGSSLTNKNIYIGTIIGNIIKNFYDKLNITVLMDNIFEIREKKSPQNNKTDKAINFNQDLNKKSETTAQYKINKHSNNYQLFGKDFEKISKIPPVGIHIGTSNCCIGVWINGKFQIIPNDLGENITPSYISFEENQILIGNEAKNKMTKNPTNTLYGILRLIGRKYDDREIQDDMKYWPFKIIKDPESNRPKIMVYYKEQKKDFYAEEILAILFSYLKQNASNFLGREVKDAVISVPNYFNHSQRQCIKDSAKIANINCLRLISDSTSIGISCYYNENCETEKNCLIFDLGGGFLNITILSVEDGRFEELALNGNIHLGGEDLDFKLIKYCIGEFMRKCGIRVRDNSKSLARLKKHCENAKIDLSFLNSTKIFIENLMDGENLDITITRSLFEDICMDLFKRCLIHLENILKDSRFSKSQFDDIIMVGGSSNIPKIQQLIKEYFNEKELIIKKNKSELVAEGASIQGAIICNLKEELIDKLVVFNVSPFSLGVETVGGVMRILIPRNSSLPTKSTILFSNYYDNQSSFLIRIFEGERQLTKDNNLIGEYILDITDPMPRWQKVIEISFEEDQNYMIIVSVKEMPNGKSKKIQIINDKDRLKKDDIDIFIKENEERINEYNEIKEVKFKKNMLEKLCYQIKSEYQDNYIKIKDKVEEILNWIKNTGYISSEEFDSKKDLIDKLLGKNPNRIINLEENRNHPLFEVQFNNHFKEDYKNKYKIMKKIGVGNNTEVFIAENKQNEEKRAIKIIKIEDIRLQLNNNFSTDEVNQQIKDIIYRLMNNEIKNMLICGKNNENSVKYYESYETEEEFAIIMELCESNLSKFRGNKKLNSKEIYEILHQLNYTFKIMRENKIIHRDLKPQNILIKYKDKDKKEFIVKLCDYGKSKLYEKTRFYSYEGTNGYMAPEIMKIIEGEYYNDKCDLWSLGIIIMELFFGENPYKGFNEIAILNNIKNFGKKVIEKTGDKKLDDLIYKLLEEDPNKRITWEQYFNHPFFKWG